jgi:hypothetical protein
MPEPSNREKGNCHAQPLLYICSAGYFRSSPTSGRHPTETSTCEKCQNRKSRTFWQSHLLREHTNVI